MTEKYSVRLEHKNASYLGDIWKTRKTNLLIGYHKLRLVRQHFINENFFESILGTTILVYSLAFYEGTLLSRKPYNYKLITRYAQEQIFPSIIYHTRSINTLAQSLRLTTSEVLYNFNPTIHSDSKILLRIDALRTWRSIVFGLFGIAQMVRLVECITNVDKVYQENVLKGKQSINIENISQRVIRFAGEESLTTNYSMSWLKHHIVPIFTNVKDNEVLLDEFTHNGEIPSFWCVNGNDYGDESEWNGFEITKNWLIKTKTGKDILIVEADSSPPEQAMLLLNDNENDLPYNVVTQAFSAIERLAIKQGVILDTNQMITVLLASEDFPLYSGSGYEYSLKEGINKFNDIDVLIDTTKPIAKAMLKWLNKYRDLELNPDNIVLFDTTNKTYFDAAKDRLKKYGWNIVDYMEFVNKNGNDGEYLNYPLLIYENSTNESVNKVRSHSKSNHSERLKNCCVLMIDYKGIETLNNLKKLEKNHCDYIENVEYICNAVLYDKIFEEVRHKLIDGYKPNEIQHWLDNEYFIPKHDDTSIVVPI